MFTGREAELETLERLRSESARRVRIVLVHGPAGIGKTSLMRQFSRLSEEKGVEVVWGRLHENVEAGVFRIWTQAIRDWIRHRGDGTRFPVDSPRAQWAARTVESLVPEIGALLRAPRSPLPAPRASAGIDDLREALPEFMHTVVAARPTVVVLDDIHLAAVDSVAVLAALSRRTGAPLLVCATSRVASSEGLAGLGNLTAIELGRLSQDDVGRLCLQSVPELPPETIRRVYELTQGNPLLVAEVSELMRIEGREEFDARDGVGGWEYRIGHRLRPLYKRRVRSLPEQHRRILIYAAALGLIVDEVKLAACLASVGKETIRNALPAGVVFGVLEEGGIAKPRYRFPSELVRESVFGIVDAAEQSRIHGAIARSLESYYDDEAEHHAAELQNHYLRSGDINDIQRGIEWTLVAGRRSIAAHEWGSGIGIYKRLLTEYGDFCNEDEGTEASYGLGRCLIHSGRKMEATRHLRSALETFERNGEAERIVELARQIISYEIGDVEYFSIVQTAMRVVPRDAEVYDSLAFFYGVGQMEALGDYAAAWETLSLQLKRAQESHRERMENAALTALAYIDVRLSRLDDAIAKCTLVMERCRRLQDPFAYVHGKFVLMQACLARRETLAASQHILSAKGPTMGMGNNVLIAGWYAMIVRFELRAGSWTKARALCGEGLSYDPDNSLLLPLYVTTELETGNLEQGDRLLERLIRSISEYPAGPYLAYASTALAIMGRWSAYGDRRWVAVARQIAEMLVERPAPPAVLIRALMVRGLGAVCEGDLRLARDVYQRLKTAPRLNLVRDYRVELVLARLASAIGEHDRASAHFDSAISDADSYPDRPALAWIHYYNAEHRMGASGGSIADETALNRELRRALRIGRELEMLPLCSRCRDMRARNDRPPKEYRGTARTVAAYSLFSDRERQVLRLLAEGMSDKEIAGILGLSVNTASNHVRHILRKTDAANRLVAVNVARRKGAL